MMFSFLAALLRAWALNLRFVSLSLALPSIRSGLRLDWYTSWWFSLCFDCYCPCCYYIFVILPLTTCMTLDKLLNSSVCEFPQLRDKTDIYLSHWAVVRIKFINIYTVFKKFLLQNKCLIHAMYYFLSLFGSFWSMILFLAFSVFFL